MAILVIAEHNNAALAAATLNTVAAAQQIGGDIHLLVAGQGCGAVAEAAAQVAGLRVRRYPGKIRQINPKCLNLKGISWGVRYLALSTTIIGLTYDLGVKIQGLDLASQIQGVVAKAVDMGRAVRR